MNFSLKIKGSLLKLAIAVAATGSLVSCFAGPCSQKISASTLVTNDAAIEDQIVEAEKSKAIVKPEDKKLVEELINNCKEMPRFELSVKDENLQIRNCIKVFSSWCKCLSRVTKDFCLNRLIFDLAQRSDGVPITQIFCSKQAKGQLLAIFKRYFGEFVKDMKENPHKFESLKKNIVDVYSFFNTHVGVLLDVCGFVNPDVFMDVYATDFAVMTDDGKCRKCSEASKIEKIFHLLFGSYPDIGRLLENKGLIVGHYDDNKFGYVVDEINVKVGESEYKNYSAKDVTDDVLKKYIEQILTLPEVRKIFVRILKEAVLRGVNAAKYIDNFKTLKLETLLENANMVKEQLCWKDVSEDRTLREMSLQSKDGGDLDRNVEEIYNSVKMFIYNFIENNGKKWPTAYSVESCFEHEVHNIDEYVLDLKEKFFEKIVKPNDTASQDLMNKLAKVELVPNNVAASSNK